MNWADTVNLTALFVLHLIVTLNVGQDNIDKNNQFDICVNLCHNFPILGE